ncbi:hypothetical protein Goklo_016048 [Gossypium klotzschianum]|uniref:Uncharacterized protein n=1 Tax=Gossypium klotzschianum TaxID=34286 RepID=A0A7J8UCQ8_9ROSI|nr:hypothetical protein [Gossypium klotzschianum]
MEMKWLETNFKELPSNATDIVKEQYAQAFILSLIEDVNHWLSAPAVVVSLVATTISTSMMEMHESDQVMRQFEWRQQIPLPPTCHGSKSSASRIYYPWRRRVGNDDHPSNVGLDTVARRYIFRGTNVPCILHLHVDIDVGANTEPNADACIVTNTGTDPVLLARLNVKVSKFCDTIHLHVDSVINIHNIIVLSSGDEDEHEGGCIVEEDEDDGDNQVDEPQALAVRKNPARTHQPSPCGTHSP